MQNPILKNWVLPAGLLAAILIFDFYFLPNATITPVSSFLILAVLAFVLPPVSMIFWACAYTFGAVYVVYHPEYFRPGPPNYALMHEIRSIGLAAGGVFSVLLCFYRLKDSRRSEQLNLLVREIPVPFVLSDGNGEIIFMNTQAADLLGVRDRKAEGDSYFSLLTDVNEKGNAIQKYLEIFDARVQREYSIELKPKNNHGVTLNGKAIPVDGSASRYMITIISGPALV